MKHIAFLFTPNDRQNVETYLDMEHTRQCIARTQLGVMDNIRAIWPSEESIHIGYDGWPCELERVT